MKGLAGYEEMEKTKSSVHFTLLRGERNRVGNSWKERVLGFEAFYVLLYFCKICDT